MNTFTFNNNVIKLSNGQKFYRYDKGGKYYSTESIQFNGVTYYDAVRGDEEQAMLPLFGTQNDQEIEVNDIEVVDAQVITG